ncbi:MAG TPA: hypothetical protein VMH28_11600 [Candidatus Acidoferrales bacterium]|nr:hypothetical protein [Candidatus Acidoferrales bacterium]
MPDFTTKIWTKERIFLVDFGRAKTGDPHMNYPEVDNIGFQDDANPSEHGRITSSVSDFENVRVRFFRTEISTSARLHMVSTNQDVVRVTDPADGVLQATRDQEIRFKAGKAGRAALEVRYNWPDGPAIGRLYVQVYDLQKIPTRLHLVKVNNFDHPENFFGQACPTRDDKVNRLKWYINQINHAWIPHGVKLVAEEEVQGSPWTNAQIGSNSVNPNYDEVLMGGALSPNRSPAHMNVYVLGQFNMGTKMALGVPVAWAKQQNRLYPKPAAGAAAPAVQHVSNGLYLRSDIMLNPVLVAHEVGHYLELCKLADSGPTAGVDQQWHSTGDTVGGAPGARDDLISRRRMMYPIIVLNQSTYPWRNDTGYGKDEKGAGKVGGLISHRRLTQDITMEESLRARTTAGSGHLFAI